MSNENHLAKPEHHIHLNNSKPIVTEWWPMPGSTRKLKALARQWSDEASDAGLTALGDRMFDIYLARQGLQPYPELVVAFQGADPVGILAGRLDYINSQFFIEGTAIHPVRATKDTAKRVFLALIDAAVDASIAQGWHGWVAYDADGAPHHELVSCGFSPAHPLYYRKMGYFA